MVLNEIIDFYKFLSLFRKYVVFSEEMRCLFPKKCVASIDAEANMTAEWVNLSILPQFPQHLSFLTNFHSELTEICDSECGTFRRNFQMKAMLELPSNGGMNFADVSCEAPLWFETNFDRVGIVVGYIQINTTETFVWYLYFEKLLLLTVKRNFDDVGYPCLK